MAICGYNKANPYTAPNNRLHVFHSWRRMRRAAQEALTKTAVQRYHLIQTKEQPSWFRHSYRIPKIVINTFSEPRLPR
jgi:hypothetical protein